jgi:hypothetical protein
MKVTAFGGGAIAMASIALALAGTVPAEAKGRTHRSPKPAAEKHNCGGKNGCPAASESTSKPAAAPTAEKPAEAK